MYKMSTPANTIPMKRISTRATPIMEQRRLVIRRKSMTRRVKVHPAAVHSTPVISTTSFKKLTQPTSMQINSIPIAITLQWLLLLRNTISLCTT